MIKSMTGYGRSEASDDRRRVTAELRSVNHRYCDVSVHMPRKYSFAEDAVKKAVKKEIHRGKIDVNITVENTGESDVDIVINEDLAGKYMKSMRSLAEKFYLDPEISLEYLSSLPDVIRTVPAAEDEDEIRSIFVEAVNKACAIHDSMRSAEGANMAEDLLSRGDLILEYVKAIEDRSPDVVEEYYTRIRDHMKELIADTAVDEERLLQEAAVFADKINVTEETVRLRSHVNQLHSFLTESGDEPVGKKLDFLVQEMNREANTIGSKANDIEITRNVLNIKSEVEKIREQVQNIE